MANAKFHFEGYKEFDELLTQMEKDFSEKDVKGVLRKAVRKAMAPALAAAQGAVSVDTGALRASLQIEARKPTNKDKRSKYVSDGDVAIGLVSTAPGYKLARLKYFNERKTKSGVNEMLKARGIKHYGMKSDARANALEFGTAKMAPRPFLRDALKNSASEVLRVLGQSLKIELERYKQRQIRRANKKG